jgi:hypothetical protein
MSQELDEPLRSHAYREYFWFAITLVALLVCAAINDTEHLADTSFATSQVAVSR